MLQAESHCLAIRVEQPGDAAVLRIPQCIPTGVAFERCGHEVGAKPDAGREHRVRHGELTTKVVERISHAVPQVFVVCEVALFKRLHQLECHVLGQQIDRGRHQQVNLERTRRDLAECLDVVAEGAELNSYPGLRLELVEQFGGYIVGEVSNAKRASLVAQSGFDGCVV